ncbi:MAG: NAD(P)-dependent oxidoreductase [Anaerolineales bacterium]|nr:NAD(P)-dependent oxidoreductase [Anaerolineales bacterium]
MTTIGLLHPGAMGTAVGAALRGQRHHVRWASAGRGPATAARAQAHGLEDAGGLPALCASAEVILSICPPHAAEAVAQAVAACGFRGIYVDANAIAPDKARRLAAGVTAAGGAFVDGGLLGGPPWQPGTTLALSGPRADEIAALFAGTPLATEYLGPEVGSASALKMCYAAYSKGMTALLVAALAAADQLGVRAALLRQWEADGGPAAQAPQRARSVTTKAWRFAGEMDEIAATFGAAGLPSGFHAAAGEIYQRLAGFKEAAEPPALEAVLAALTGRAADA